MIEVPVYATVECTDGVVGKSTHVVINPTTRKLTHFVVREEESFASNQWLVPIDKVSETRHDLIRLDCTIEEMNEMEPFVDVHYVPNPGAEPGYPADSVYLAPYVSPLDMEYVPMEVEHVPAGELAIHRGAIVEATDGYVGKVGEFLIDPDSGQITHLVLQEGHLWGKKEITLPLSAVDQALENSILLKLDMDAVNQLPAIPVKRDYGKEGQAGGIEMMAKTFGNPDEAAEALAHIKEINRQQKKAFKIHDAAVIVKDEDGKTSVKETADLSTGQGRLLGAVVGGLIGLVGGPVGVIIGALAGAGTGAYTAKHVDMGISDEFLKSLQDKLLPGTSALVILVDGQGVEALSASMADMGDVELRHTLSDKIVAQLLEEQRLEEDADEN